MRLEQFDNAITVDILNDTDIIDRSIDLHVFLSTIIILQYKLILAFWYHFKCLNYPNVFTQKFEDMNSLLYHDVVHLLSKTKEIIKNENYKQIVCLRDYYEAKRIMENDFSILGYSLALGKVLFLSGNKIASSDNVMPISIVSNELRRFFNDLSNDARVLIPGASECRLLNINQSLAMGLIKNIMVKEIPNKLIKYNINVAEKYGKCMV